MEKTLKKINEEINERFLKSDEKDYSEDTANKIEIYEKQFQNFFQKESSVFINNDFFYKPFIKFIYNKYLYVDNNSNVFNSDEKEKFIENEMKDYINHLSKEILKVKHKNDLLFNNLNQISMLKYENNSILGEIVIIDFEKNRNNIDLYVEFENPIEISQIRLMRKLVEISDSELFLIGNGLEFYGFGKLKNLQNLENDKIIIIEFLGRYYFNVNLGKIVRKIKKDDKESNSEVIKYVIEKKFALAIQDNKAKLNNISFSEKTLNETIEKVFIGKKVDKEKIVILVKKAVLQKKGTMIVISELAENESKRLRKQAIKIIPGIISENNIENYTRIDGALLFDLEMRCHLIGGILDGIADEDIGEPSRGARYNSALRYINQSKLKKKTLIIVISEDGMVDILPNYEEEKAKRINVMMSKAIEYLEKEKYTNAITILNKIIKDEEYILAYLLRGDTYFKNKNIEEAIKDFNFVLKIDEKNSKAHFRLGMVYTEEKNYEKALEHYKYALNLDSNNVRIMQMIALVYEKQKKYSDAITILEQVLNYLPSDYKIFCDLARNFHLKGEEAKALEYYNKAIEIDDKDCYAYCKIGNINKNNKKYSEAKENYDKAIENKSECQTLLLNMSEIYYRKKEYRIALDYLEKARKKGNVSFEISINAGACYFALKDYKKALEFYFEALDIEPKSSEVILNIILVYSELDEKDKVGEYVRKVIENKNIKINTYLRIGEILLLKKYYEIGIEILREANNKYEDNKEIIEMLANFHIMLNETENAIECCKKIEKIEKNNLQNNINLKELYILNNQYTKAFEVEICKTKNKEYFAVFYLLDEIAKIMLNSNYEIENFYLKYSIEKIKRNKNVNWTSRDLKNWSEQVSDDEKKVKILRLLNLFK